MARRRRRLWAICLAAVALVGCSGPDRPARTTPEYRYVALVDQRLVSVLAFQSWLQGGCESHPDVVGCPKLPAASARRDALARTLQVEASAVDALRSALQSLGPPSARAERDLRILRPALQAYSRSWERYDGCLSSSDHTCRGLRLAAIREASAVTQAVQSWRRRTDPDL